MMLGNGDHDPLDGWLSQQVQPLPPPPGTFELITRRARRRKIRKLVVTVASAAAVAAAVAVAVPGGLLLRISPSQVSANPLANGQPPTPTIGGSHRVTGSGSPLPRPTRAPTQPPVPKPSSPRSSGGVTPEPTGPVPKNFQPSSITFVNTSHGWAIGQAGTPGHCANQNPYICTSIVRTDNAGHAWRGGPAPATGAPSGATGVNGIRFLDGMNGWAFGPELWVTHDAGNTWYKVPAADGFRVTDLETVRGQAYALFATCKGGGADFAADCTQYTLMTTAADSDNWQPVGGPTSGMTAGGAPTSAVLALTDATGYLIAPDGTLYSGPIGGGPWAKAGTVNCQPGPAQANGLPSRALLGLQNSTTLAVACIGPSFGGVTVFTSSDGGMLWHQQSDVAWSGMAQPITATSFNDAVNGTLLLAMSSGIYVLPAGGSHWKQAVGPFAPTGAPPGGFTYVGMTTGKQGIAVPADGELHEIWITENGGLTWAPATPITPAG
jgi:hypothetical protein